MIQFRTATVEFHDGIMVSTFSDGKRNRYDPSWAKDDQEYQDIAKWAGYGGDWQRYGIEHDLTHHWLADRLGWAWSWSLHENRRQPWPDHIAWEEHVVNRLQRYARTGEPDEHGVLQAMFGGDLEGNVEDLRRILVVSVT